MTQKTDEPWAAWAEQMQKWMSNPAALNPFGAASTPGNPFASSAAFANPFAGFQGANPLDPQAMMKAIDPAEIDRRINEMRAVETWLKFSLSTLEMSIKTMQMQRDAYASFQQMSSSAQEGAEKVRRTVKRAARSRSK
jgi:hypothetical protein